MNIWDWIMTPEFCFIFPAAMVGLMLLGLNLADRILDWWMDWLLAKLGAAKGGYQDQQMDSEDIETGDDDVWNSSRAVSKK